MSAESARRSVTLLRSEPGSFRATATSGATIDIGGTAGAGTPPRFTPVELLLAALGACTAIDVDVLTSRRAEPEHFEVVVEADKIRDEHGNRLTNLSVAFHVGFPDGGAGDAARALLPDAVRRSHDRLCTVGRTLEVGAPVTATVDG